MERRGWIDYITCAGILLVLGLTLTAASDQVRAEGPTIEGGTGLQAAVGTAFTYQGRLVQNGSPVTGICDFQFSLWDFASGSTQVGSTLTSTGIPVNDGFFMVTLDFGDGGLGTATFAGEARWLAVSLRCPTGVGAYTPLAGRAALSPTPYALSLRPGAVIAGDKSSLTVLTARNTTAAAFGAGFKAETSAAQGTALIAEAKATGLEHSYGIYATTASRGGTAVYGESKHGSSAVDNTAYGGFFKANASGDVGVHGESAWSQGGGIGVEGRSNGAYGAGVSGVAAHTAGENHGVYGETKSPNGSGVYGKSPASGGSGVYGYSASGHGIHGKANPPDGYALYSEGNTHIDGNLTWKPRTGYIAVSAAAFHPADSSTDYLITEAGLLNTRDVVCPGGDALKDFGFVAAVNLPHGVTITEMTLHGFNAGIPKPGGSEDCNTIILMLISTTPWSVSYHAQIRYPASPGMGYPGDTFFSAADRGLSERVNNEDITYYLTLNLPSQATLGELTFHSARIAYTYNEPY